MNNLFQTITGDTNLLPYDGEAYYYSRCLDNPEEFFRQLYQEINWQPEKIWMFGKQITTKRQVAWYADENLNYTYSGTTKIALAWTPTLVLLKEKIENLTKTTYNSCLVNFYHNGQEGMGWHSDNEKQLLHQGSIASLSFGATRKFVFKHKVHKTKTELILENGSLLLMRGAVQEYWMHSLPTSKKIKNARINLTFRTIVT